jgi:hypothetical protein
MPASRQVGGVDPVLLEACATTDATTGAAAGVVCPAFALAFRQPRLATLAALGSTRDVMDDEQDPEQDSWVDWWLPNPSEAIIRCTGLIALCCVGFCRCSL